VNSRTTAAQLAALKQAIEDGWKQSTLGQPWRGPTRMSEPR
jgi:hypothetical protein